MIFNLLSSRFYKFIFSLFYLVSLSLSKANAITYKLGYEYLDFIVFVYGQYASFLRSLHI